MRNYIILHLIILLYSLSGVFSKLAASEHFLSFRFCLFYGAVMVLLSVYALVWQQVIKQIPLTTAFANKAASTVWGLIWGVILFQEQITIGKIAGIAVIIVGIVVYFWGEGE